ncbi:MAG: SAM-dependent chlorinase/fluorinase [Bryobacteraceae bacterium]
MPIVTLTTDFGDSDHFTASMKGAILSIAPRVTIVDVTHQIAPFAIEEGAFTIAEASRGFPKKTVHVGVVDPGVGSARRPILVETGGQYFVGPDNGLLSMVYGRDAKSKVRHITNSDYFAKQVSATFHGRDIFAPVAAHLAKGVRPAAMGPEIEDFLRPATEGPVRTDKRCWTGSVVKVDRFGNLITNIHVDQFPAIRERPILLITGVHPVEKLVGTFADGPVGEPFLVVGSSGYLEVAFQQESAAKKLGCRTGTPVELTVY